MVKKILHVLYNDKFINPFIDFIKDNQIEGEHIFLYFGGSSKEDFPYAKYKNVYVFDYEKSRLDRVKYSLKFFHQADQIILHSLINPYLVRFLYLQPWLLKKCYWVMWGADLYYHTMAEKNEIYYIREKWRKKVIGNMAGLITYIKGDYELAKQWYGVKGKYYECFMYPSNLYKEYNVKENEHEEINILLGNSADPTNNHIEMLKNLEQYKDENIKIWVPLSYGDQEHAKNVIKKGNEIFGEKFQPLTTFMPFNEYLEFLGKIDIAIFAHKRQQAMGNTITLLGLGKKVYLDSTTVQWDFFDKHKVEVFNINEIELKKLSIPSKHKNQEKIEQLFSKESLISGLKEIFDV